MKKHPGRIKYRLAQMLAQHGVDVDPYNLRVNYGYNTARMDGCSWNGPGRRGGIAVNVFSMDTMSNLIRFGFSIHEWEKWDIELFRDGDAGGHS